MSKESFSERILRQFIEYCKEIEQSQGILNLVTMYVDEYKKREKLEKDIKGILIPYFDEKTGEILIGLEIPATKEAPDIDMIKKLMQDLRKVYKIVNRGE